MSSAAASASAPLVGPPSDEQLARELGADDGEDGVGTEKRGGRRLIGKLTRRLGGKKKKKKDRSSLLQSGEAGNFTQQEAARFGLNNEEAVKVALEQSLNDHQPIKTEEEEMHMAMAMSLSEQEVPNAENAQVQEVVARSAEERAESVDLIDFARVEPMDSAPAPTPSPAPAPVPLQPMYAQHPMPVPMPAPVPAFAPSAAPMAMSAHAHAPPPALHSPYGHGAAPVTHAPAPAPAFYQHAPAPVHAHQAAQPPPHYVEYTVAPAQTAHNPYLAK